MKPSRPKFIQTAGAFSIASMAMPSIAGNPAFHGISSEEIDIKSLFNANREDAFGYY